MIDPFDFNRYRTEHCKEYVKSNRFGYMYIDVLPILIGKKWNQYSLGMIHSLRPSSIRVSTGTVTCDAQRWRVTIIVDENDIIKSVKQEVEVSLPEDVKHGNHLSSLLGDY
jgi:hypothetical protein